MQRITGEEYDKIEKYFRMAADEAKKAKCKNALCGTVIVKDEKVIGRGSNGPAKGDEQTSYCQANFDTNKKPKYDTTCCVHAEWRAIINACKEFGQEIEGSTLYFMRVDEHGNFTGAGQPYCTVCSRLALESGIAEFVLWHDDGANSYDTKEYNEVSYNYHR